jgi:CheY-like chemotaxis protein
MKKPLLEKLKFNIVLADDDDDDRYMFREALKELGLHLKIHIVDNGYKLIKYLDTAKLLPDIIFLDLHMPAMDGIECLREIKKKPGNDNVCIIIFSTSSLEEDIEATFGLGANIYLVKPNEFNELKALLYKVIVFNSHYRKPFIRRETFVMGLDEISVTT